MNTQKTKGFTLVETMVAITILTLAVSGAFLAANTALIAANISRDQLIASYLAQEGVEYARMKRDNTYLSSGGVSIPALAWSNLFTSGAYIDGLGSASAPFTRMITATPTTDKDEKIVSTVSWNFHDTTYSVIITDHLTPWQ